MTPEGASGEAASACRRPAGDAVPPTVDDVRLESIVDLLSKVIAPASTVTAMLYFFGYTRERAFYAYFGMPLGTAGFSTTDYLVRGAGVAFMPLAVLLVVVAVALIVRPALVAFLARSSVRATKSIMLMVAAVGLVLLGTGIAGLLVPSKKIGFDLLAPAALGGTAVAVGWTLALAKRNPALPETMRRSLSSGATAYTGVTLVMLALVALFWATAVIGRQNGLRAARIYERSLPTSSRAVVYSHQRIGINGRGINFEILEARDAVYAYRYSGLRVLLHSGGRWFLLPAGWTHDNGEFVILMKDADSGVRIELAP